jgi:hypothetical protein
VTRIYPHNAIAQARLDFAIHTLTTAYKSLSANPRNRTELLISIQLNATRIKFLAGELLAEDPQLAAASSCTL